MKLFLLMISAALALSANEDFFEAARKGDVATLKTHLDKGVPVDTKWRYDQTALFMAARNGHLDAVKLLLERGAKADAKDSFYTMTALSGAAEKKNPELVKLLLANGATGADQTFTAMIGSKQPAMVQVFLESGKVSPDTLSAGLAAASASGATEIAEILKSAGVKPPEEAKIDPAVLARYAGTYRDNNNEVKLALVDGRLQAAAFGQVLPMRAVDTITFAPLLHPGIRMTFKVEGEKVTGFEFKQGQMTLFYNRSEAK